MPGDLGLAFVAGLLSCASACVLPLLPAFVAYLGGVSTAGGRSRPVVAAGLFVAGFGSAFVALGAGAGLAGAGLAAFRPALVAASGVVLVGLGVLLVAGVPWLMRERRLHLAHRLPRTPLAAYLVGVTFAVGWTPCVGPILSAILVEAADSATAGRGAALLASYSAGLGLPFVATSLFIEPVSAALGRMRGAYPVLNAAAAALLIGMGVLTVTGRLTEVNGFAPRLPAVQSAGLRSELPPAAAAASPGGPAPAVAVTGVDGSHLALRDLRGRPVLVTFFATWCVPCQDELPLLDAAARDHRSDGLAVVPIDYEESAPAVAGFWRNLHLQLTPYLDPDGAAARSFGVGLSAGGLPVTVLVDRKGHVSSVVPGQIGPDLLAARLDRILHE